MADENEPVVEPVEADTPAPVEAQPEPDAVIDTVAEHVADEPVELAPEEPEPMPAEISDQLPRDTDAQTVARIEAFLSDARYFVSTLEHEVTGGAGEIIAYLKSRL